MIAYECDKCDRVVDFTVCIETHMIDVHCMKVKYTLKGLDSVHHAQIFSIDSLERFDDALHVHAAYA